MKDIFLVKEWAASYLIPWSLNVLLAVIIIGLGWIGSKLFVKLFVKILTRSGVDEMLIGFFKSMVHGILLIFVFVAALDRLGVNTNSLVALLGAAGLAVGLALQGSLQNFAAGLMLLLFRPFKKGDFVELTMCSGLIQRIRLFTTTLRTGDYKEITIPNGAIYKSHIINHFKLVTRRIDLVINVDYKNDVLVVRKILMDVLKENSCVLQNPEPIVAIDELAVGKIVFVVRPWVKSTDYGDVKFALNEKIKCAFDAHGIIFANSPPPDSALVSKTSQDNG